MKNGTSGGGSRLNNSSPLFLSFCLSVFFFFSYSSFILVFLFDGRKVERESIPATRTPESKGTWMKGEEEEEDDDDDENKSTDSHLKIETITFRSKNACRVVDTLPTIITITQNGN